MKKNERITEIEKNIKEMEEKLVKQKKLVVKLKNNEYEIGDIVNYCNIEWYVIDVVDDLLTLMTKDTAGGTTYSYENSNDYHDSNVKEYLEKVFIDKLYPADLEEMVTNYDEDKVATTQIRIPALREIEKLPANIRECNGGYWTMTASYGISCDLDRPSVFGVNSYGSLDWYDVNDARGVRPVIKIEKSSLT